MTATEMLETISCGKQFSIDAEKPVLLPVLVCPGQSVIPNMSIQFKDGTETQFIFPGENAYQYLRIEQPGKIQTNVNTVFAKPIALNIPQRGKG